MAFSQEQFLYEFNLLDQIFRVNNAEKLKIYLSRFDILKNFQIVFVDEQYGNNSVKFMREILGLGEEYLYSPFCSDKISILNKNISLKEQRFKNYLKYL